MEDEPFDFSRYGSSLGREERVFLGIRITETDDPSMIFSGTSDFAVPPYLKHLELEKFGVSQILRYKPHEQPDLFGSQRLFLQRLQDVLLNRLDSSSRFDLYLRDLVSFLIMESQLNDGLNLYVRYSKLSLKVGEENYTLFSDREGRNATGIMWVLQECANKFDTRYKKGDVQIAASLIGACQANLHQSGGELKVKTLYGVKVVGEEFFFCRIDFDEKYMKQLARKVTPNEVMVHRYPSSRGLRISKVDDRKKLLCFIHKLRHHMIEGSQS